MSVLRKDEVTGLDIKVSPEMNLHQVSSERPSYLYRKIYPANGGSRTINLVAGGATQNTIFNIPVEVLNMGDSYLEYKIAIADQAASNYPWVYNTIFGEFDQVLYRDTGSMNVVELKYAHYYQELMNRINTSKDKLDYNDALQGMVRTNDSLAGLRSLRSDGNPCSLPYIEPQHLLRGTVGTGATTASLVINRKIYLKDLCPDSFFGLAKNWLFPVETYLDITWNGSNLGFRSNSPMDPTSGAAALSAPAADIVTPINGMKKMLATSKTLPIPWIKVHNLVQSSGAPYSYNLPLDNKQHGRKIKKIVYAPYNATSTSNNIYDHCNDGSADNDAHSKVWTYQTELDSQKLQRDIVQCPTTTDSTLHDDYMIHKKILQNTTYYNQPMYNYNWFHMDKFDYEFSNDNKEGYIRIDGYDLVKPVTWTFNAFTGRAGAAAPRNICVVIGEKLLTCDPVSFVVV